MARFRNVYTEALFVPEGTPQSVEPDGLFEVSDDRAAAFEESPYFAPVATKTPRKGE